MITALGYIEDLLKLLPRTTGNRLVCFLKVFLEHLIKRHGRELGKCFKSYTGFAKLVCWAGNAARCAAKVVILDKNVNLTANVDCPHGVDAEHGRSIDL